MGSAVSYAGLGTWPKPLRPVPPRPMRKRRDDRCHRTAEPTRRDDAPRPMERRTILIVDDVRDVVATLALLLESEGYGVIKAYDGHRAWRLARTQLPDAVITDVSMPRMDGLELCRRLRRHPWTRHIPIIVSSALPVPVSEAGWHDLQLRKPACLDDILTGLSRLLAR
jgi:CheY-like chemotaxis protein